MFTIVFYGGSVPIVLAAPVAALFGAQALIAHAMRWARFHRWCARLRCSASACAIEGERAGGPVLYAVKHEAIFETIELPALLDAPGDGR